MTSLHCAQHFWHTASEVQREGKTVRIAVAVCVFLFGTTFLWLMPVMSGKQADLSGGRWTVVQVLVWLSIIGFAAAAWGIFRSNDWWAPVTAGSAVLGVAATVTYVIAARGLPGIANFGSNVAIHLGVSLVIFVAIATPPLREAISQRL
jgi:peptidoglycan/LPS O-acetylase OafA/YrhL